MQSTTTKRFIISILIATALAAAVSVPSAAQPTGNAQPPAGKSKTAKRAEPRSPSEEIPPPSTNIARSEAITPPADATLTNERAAAERNFRRLLLVSGISIFVLAVFVGFEVISKVPATLHTPLMSGSNAISGITVVGAIIAASTGWGFASFLGFFAIIAAMVNVVGGFLVTHRMLLMFKRK